MKVRTIRCVLGNLTIIRLNDDCECLRNVVLHQQSIIEFEIIKKKSETKESIRNVEICRNSCWVRKIDINAPITQLKMLSSNIVELSFLKNLQTLQLLCLSDNHIHDISPLQLLEGLFYLDLAKNRIEDISPLRNLVDLKYINLSDNRICSILHLSAMRNLRHLLISNNNHL